jgi:hypothetical protein
MLARGVTYPYLAELLKGLFVDVAEHDFRLDGRPQSDSRISLLSGVHRKDVKRLREHLEENFDHLPEKVSFGAQLISLWTTVEPFCSAVGKPRPLARLVSQGGERSFDALVARQSTDIRARVVLDEWMRLGLVELNDKDEVVLRTEAYVPAHGGDEQLAYFGHNIHDHMAAAVHNVTGGNPPFFERSVHYDALSAESVERLASRVKVDGMEMLLAFNALAMECEQADAERINADQRMTIGLYFYSEAGHSPPGRGRRDG